MLLSEVWTVLQQDVLFETSPDRQFNPYSERNPRVDTQNAPAIRRANLQRYLGYYEDMPPVFLLAEAPGPWGCRFSGVPITSEAQLCDPGFPFDGDRSSLQEAPHTEYSATIYWRVMQRYLPYFFTWNAVPYHPHDEGDPLSIRNPGRREVRAFQPVLRAVLDVIRPDRVVAIGRKAERSLNEIGRPCTYVRHPSQGGARKFNTGITAVFEEMNLEPADADMPRRT